MESTPVVIVGAGPSGLVLGLSLAHYKVHSIILEKEDDITDDPRGVYLAGDALRVLWQVGIAKDIPNIGHEIGNINFHKSSFKNPPFFEIDVTRDWANHAIPMGILQSQPKLERALREQVKTSKYCTLRCACEVIKRQEIKDGVIVGYIDKDLIRKQITCQWLVGADGKRGVVRKNFLEPSAGIKQGPGLFLYEGTWVAANLFITPPTPQTHPNFPLWKLGFTPDRVYDLFWPKGWHFCSPPGKPTACGRFGPHEDHLWRHEFAEEGWKDSMDAENLLWEHLSPMITRHEDEHGRRFPEDGVTFPRDCIKIMRCRPFTFTQKVVNRWFDNRTILIGDAAHVFPPFGGQGIACGVRDADGLAWRLALLSRIVSVNRGFSDRILNAWARERRQGVDDSTKLTLQNGNLCNNEETWGFFFARSVLSILQQIPFLSSITQMPVPTEANGYKATKEGFYLAEHGGGGKLAQIYVEEFPRDSHGPFAPQLLSDEILKQVPTLMVMLVVGVYSAETETQLKKILKDASCPPSVLSQNSIIHFCPTASEEALEAYANAMDASKPRPKICFPTSVHALRPNSTRPGYDPAVFVARLGGPSTRYVIIRPDNIIFALARDQQQLADCLYGLQTWLS